MNENKLVNYIPSLKYMLSTIETFKQYARERINKLLKRSRKIK